VKSNPARLYGGSFLKKKKRFRGKFLLSGIRSHEPVGAGVPVFLENQCYNHFLPKLAAF
jgi:hypothetical protein